MTTSQQPRYGRHARFDEPDGTPSSAPSFPPSSVPWQRPASGPDRPTGAVEPVAGPTGPGFGEWPFGTHKQDDEPQGPNPYLPCDEEVHHARVTPGGLPGTLALLAGMAGLGLSLFPVVAIAVWPLTLAGIVLGIVGLRRIRAGSGGSSVVAVLGIVLSAAGLALCATWLAMYAAAGVGAGGVETSAVPSVVPTAVG